MFGMGDHPGLTLDCGSPAASTYTRASSMYTFHGPTRFNPSSVSLDDFNATIDADGVSLWQRTPFPATIRPADIDQSVPPKMLSCGRGGSVAIRRCHRHVVLGADNNVNNLHATNNGGPAQNANRAPHGAQGVEIVVKRIGPEETKGGSGSGRSKEWQDLARRELATLMLLSRGCATLPIPPSQSAGTPGKMSSFSAYAPFVPSVPTRPLQAASRTNSGRTKSGLDSALATPSNGASGSRGAPTLPSTTTSADARASVAAHRASTASKSYGSGTPSAGAAGGHRYSPGRTVASTISSRNGPGTGTDSTGGHNLTSPLLPAALQQVSSGMHDPTVNGVVPGDAAFVVELLGAWTEGDDVCIAMEKMAGSLDAFVEHPDPEDPSGRAMTPGTPLPTEVLKSVAVMLLRGTRHLHNLGLVHRDLKPANVLFDETAGVVKIADFGLAARLSPEHMTRKVEAGAAAYRCPERVHGQQHSFATDIWAIGIILAELALGHFPFETVRGVDTDSTFLALGCLYMEGALDSTPESQELGCGGYAMNARREILECKNLSHEMKAWLLQFVLVPPELRLTCTQLLDTEFLSAAATSMFSAAAAATVKSPAATVSSERYMSTPPRARRMTPSRRAVKVTPPLSRIMDGGEGDDGVENTLRAGVSSGSFLDDASVSRAASNLWSERQDTDDLTALTASTSLNELEGPLSKHANLSLSSVQRRTYAAAELSRTSSGAANAKCTTSAVSFAEALETEEEQQTRDAHDTRGHLVVNEVVDEGGEPHHGDDGAATLQAQSGEVFHSQCSLSAAAMMEPSAGEYELRIATDVTAQVSDEFSSGAPSPPLSLNQPPSTHPSGACRADTATNSPGSAHHPPASSRSPMSNRGDYERGTPTGNSVGVHPARSPGSGPHAYLRPSPVSDSADLHGLPGSSRGGHDRQFSTVTDVTQPPRSDVDSTRSDDFFRPRRPFVGLGEHASPVGGLAGGGAVSSERSDTPSGDTHHHSPDPRHVHPRSFSALEAEHTQTFSSPHSHSVSVTDSADQQSLDLPHQCGDTATDHSSSFMTSSGFHNRPTPLAARAGRPPLQRFSTDAVPGSSMLQHGRGVALQLHSKNKPGRGRNDDRHDDDDGDEEDDDDDTATDDTRRFSFVSGPTAASDTTHSPQTATRPPLGFGGSFGTRLSQSHDVSTPTLGTAPYYGSFSIAGPMIVTRETSLAFDTPTLQDDRASVTLSALSTHFMTSGGDVCADVAGGYDSDSDSDDDGGDSRPMPMAARFMVSGDLNDDDDDGNNATESEEDDDDGEDNVEGIAAVEKGDAANFDIPQREYTATPVELHVGEKTDSNAQREVTPAAGSHDDRPSTQLPQPLAETEQSAVLQPLESTQASPIVSHDPTLGDCLVSAVSADFVNPEMLAAVAAAAQTSDHRDVGAHADHHQGDGAHGENARGDGTQRAQGDSAEADDAPGNGGVAGDAVPSVGEVPSSLVDAIKSVASDNTASTPSAKTPATETTAAMLMHSTSSHGDVSPAPEKPTVTHEEAAEDAAVVDDPNASVSKVAAAQEPQLLPFEPFTLTIDTSMTSDGGRSREHSCQTSGAFDSRQATSGMSCLEPHSALIKHLSGTSTMSAANRSSSSRPGGLSTTESITGTSALEPTLLWQRRDRPPLTVSKPSPTPSRGPIALPPAMLEKLAANGTSPPRSRLLAAASNAGGAASDGCPIAVDPATGQPLTVQVDALGSTTSAAAAATITGRRRDFGRTGSGRLSTSPGLAHTVQYQDPSRGASPQSAGQNPQNTQNPKQQQQAQRQQQYSRPGFLDAANSGTTKTPVVGQHPSQQHRAVSQAASTPAGSVAASVASSFVPGPHRPSLRSVMSGSELRSTASESLPATPSMLFMPQTPQDADVGDPRLAAWFTTALRRRD